MNLAFQKSFTKLGVPIKKITSVGVRRAIDQYRGDLTEGLLSEDFVRLAGHRATRARVKGIRRRDAPALEASDRLSL